MGRNPRTWIRDRPGGARITLNREARRALPHDLDRGWAETMARRHGLVGLIEDRMAMGPGPGHRLEDHLDASVPDLGSDLARALWGCSGKRREAVRAAFALHGPGAAERLSQDPASLVDELLEAVERLDRPRTTGREEALATLGLHLDAPLEAVKAAHRSLVKRHHPDRGGRAEDFHRITAAYRLLVRVVP